MKPSFEVIVCDSVKGKLFQQETNMSYNVSVPEILATHLNSAKTPSAQFYSWSNFQNPIKSRILYHDYNSLTFQTILCNLANLSFASDYGILAISSCDNKFLHFAYHIRFLLYLYFISFFLITPDISIYRPP